MNRTYNKKLAQISLGKEEADIVLKNGQVVNVFTNEILRADVAVSDGLIVGIGSYKGKQEIDAVGKIICPGFIDAHLHLESTLVKPSELIHRAVRKGTTTFIVDPHEAANVSGVKGISYILEQTEQTRANVFIMLPSCVPALEIEDNGAVISAEDMSEFLANPRILGLGEVMDCRAVLNGDKKMLDKLKLFEDKNIDGHAGQIEEKQLMCYKLAGINTDHECCDYETAMKEARAGLQVLIREGTAAKNLEAIVSGIVKNRVPTEQFCFCTDDKHIAEIEKDGHIGFHVKKAIALGISPVEAIKMATLNAARTYGLKRLGAVAPGYQADLVVLSDLKSCNIEQVFHKGMEVCDRMDKLRTPVDAELLNTVKIAKFNSKDLELQCASPKMPLIELVKGQILTHKSIEAVPVRNGCFQANAVYNKVAVLERHKASGKYGLGILKGYEIHNGAIASTFAHDSHNLIAVGDNDTDMLLAIKELERCGGGYTLVEKGQIMHTLELPIMGLISNNDHKFVTEKISQMIEKIHEMGVPEGIDPFITLSFLALPVIPEIRITSRGLYDVEEETFI